MPNSHLHIIRLGGNKHELEVRWAAPLVQVVSLHCNLDENTFHLLNEDRLNMMKKDAVLINCARGPVIDEVALTNFLQANENFRSASLHQYCRTTYTIISLHVDHPVFEIHVRQTPRWRAICTSMDGHIHLVKDARTHILSVLEHAALPCAACAAFKGLLDRGRVFLTGVVCAEGSVGCLRMIHG